MYRMLIVDDEKNERDCILYLLKSSGFELEIREAEDGIEALKILKIWPAHILFTDVQMSRMDGLELIREALKQYPDIRPVIFSGYADFAYAKTAISLGVENYILKPVVPEEFTKTLSSLIGQLDEEQVSLHQLENQKLFLLQYSLQLAISGNFDAAKAEPVVLEQFSTFRYMVMFTFKNDFLMHQSSAFFDSLRKDLAPDAVSVNISPEQAVLFVRTPILNAKHFCTKLQDHIRNLFSTDCYIAITKSLSEYSSFKQAFSFLEQQMEQRFFLPDTRIFLPDDTPVQCSQNTEDDSQLLPLIKNALAARSQTLLEECLGHLFDKYKLAVNQSQIYVKFLFSNVLTILYPAIPEQAQGSFPPLETMIANLYLQPDISEIISIVKGVSKPILDSFSTEPDSMRKEVSCAISYIANHYSEDLSAEILASAVYLTPDYLSRLFKKSTGKSISQYIRQYRMEKAKDALLHTRKKVIDIGIQSGYPNYSYFCQSFREYFGSSPEKYRQEHTA